MTVLINVQLLLFVVSVGFIPIILKSKSLPKEDKLRVI